MPNMESGGASPFPVASRTATPSGSNLNPNAPGKKVKICVYCGSAPGTTPAHLEAARELGTLMAKNDISLVYGGGTVGLMGEVAKTIVAISGPDAVHGIIPEALVKFERDATYAGEKDDDGHFLPKVGVYGRTTVVPDMHTRKKMMAEEVIAGADGSGFIALSGGYGTMEELFEVLTWNQLGIHNKGVCVLNVNGFYNGLLDWLKKAVEEDFIRTANADILVTANTAEEAIQALKTYKVSSSRFDLSWETR